MKQNQDINCNLHYRFYDIVHIFVSQFFLKKWPAKILWDFLSFFFPKQWHRLILSWSGNLIQLWHHIRMHGARCALPNKAVLHQNEVLKNISAVNCQEIWDLEINGKIYSLLNFLERLLLYLLVPIPRDLAGIWEWMETFNPFLEICL